MNKLILGRLAPIGWGLLTLGAYTRPSTAVSHCNDWNEAEYQKRQVVISTQTNRFNWLRMLLFSSLLAWAALTAHAQTNWSDWYQNTGGRLVDVAYGANVYVAVGDDGTILRSADSKVWTTAVEPGNADKGLASVVYAMGQFVAVGYMGRVLTSPDGTVWTARASGTSKSLKGIAFGGGKFIAVGQDGTAILSTDGQTWTSQLVASTLSVNAVAYGAGWFVAVGEGGVVESSSDGINWSIGASQTTANLKGIAAGFGGSWVAVGTNGTIITTSDGTLWSAQVVSNAATQFTAVAYNAWKGQFVAVAMTGAQLYVSTDRKTWTAYPTGTTAYLSGIDYKNDQFIVLGENGLIRTSTNGTNWQGRTLEYDDAFNGVAFGNGRYVAVGAINPANNALIANLAATSTDGEHYSPGETVRLPNAGRQFNDVAFGNGLFAAVGEDGIIQTSSDGKVWDFRQVVVGQTLQAVAFGAGRFVAIGDNGYIARSSDGKSWSSGFTGLSSTYKGVTFANGQFMAVGENGAIATSPDGVVWTAQSSLTNQSLQSAAFGNGRWVVVGYDGVIGCRLNGLPWIVYSVGIGIMFTDIVFSNGQFVAVGLNKKISTSVDGFTWTSHKSTFPATGNLNSITHGNGLFVTVGSTPFVTTSPDAINATTKPPVTANARLAAEEPTIGLQANVYPNPVVDDFTVVIDGAGDQPVRLWLVDASGHTVIDKQIIVGDGTQQEAMSLVRQDPGMYVLRVSAAGQVKTLKVLKQ